MTIQPSILIWTLISFALLMLILDRLLFRPMLSFMDARNERIEAAMQKKEADAHALSEAEAELAARREQALIRTAEIAETEIADAKVRAKRMIAKAEADRETRMEVCRNEITLKSRELETGLENGIDRLAKAFADKLVS